MSVKKVRYFTKDKLALISEDNKKKYEKYYQSCTIRNRDMKDTTYKTYLNCVTHFMAYLAEFHNNVGLYSDEFFENAVDIMEGYIAFCQETLLNGKKVINTKLSAVSSFYNWSLKRGLIDKHPFDKKLERLKGANEERVINDYFLTDDQIKVIKKALASDNKYDIQDQIIFNLMLDSANRIGAIEKLTLASLNLDSKLFSNIREKRGYRVDVVFGDFTKELIEEWLEMRRYMDDLKVDALFIAKHNYSYSPMARNTIQKRINKIGKIIGLDDFHAHCMRKSSLNSIYEDTGLKFGGRNGKP
jgi:integrase/recombinase XerC